MRTLARGGREWQPLDVDLTTYTLRYNRMHWLTAEGLEEHWTRGHITATLLSGEIDVEADGVTDFTLSFPAGECPMDVQSPVVLVVGEQELDAPAPKSDRSWAVSLHKVRGEWRMCRRRNGGPWPRAAAFRVTRRAKQEASCSCPRPRLPAVLDR